MAKPNSQWYRLDNAGILYSALQREEYSAIYRFSALMTEPVRPAALQNAIDRVLPRFPSFAVRIRRGLFWYYLEPNTAPMAGMDYEEFSIGAMPAAWTRPKVPHGDRRVILYCHGGGYTSGNLGYSRVLSSKLAHVTGYDVLSFEYRLAPEHPYPAAVEDALRAWDYLMYQGYGAENVTVAGDSAGGNLALVLCRRLKAAGRRMPRALLLMSPWTDMTMSGASYRERVESDPMLTPEYIEAVRRAYAGDRDLHDPDLSPLLGDLGSFPPTLIQVGDHEILYSDSASLAAALRAAHVPCRLEVSEGMWHVFQMFPIKKAAAAMESAARFLLEL